MTPRERFIAALERRPLTGRVPHFELVFFLTMEAFGRVHPLQRSYHQWGQMSETERELHRRDVADVQLVTARTYEQSGIHFMIPPGWEETDVRRSMEYFREIGGDEYFLAMHGDATYGLPSGSNMVDYVMRIAEEPDKVLDDAQRMVDEALAKGERLKSWGVLDGFCLCADYCFNDNPFLSPRMFGKFVTPFLQQLVAGYREMGYYVIKHTDGNIMPILDDLVSAKPHALHSLDPQGGVDIAEVKRRVGDQVCLIGNVNCGLLQTGTEEEVVESCRYALRHGMPGGGYIFSTSNCIYTGLPLERYDLMLDVWRREGNYPE